METLTTAAAQSAPPAGRPVEDDVRPGVLDHEAYRATRYFPALDGVRALAVILVFTVHVKYEQFWGRLFGGNGVTIFFVLSGFLITTLALREESRRGALGLRSFYTRRLFRIYPMYFGILLLYCVLIYGLGMTPERRGLFSDQLPYYVLGYPEHGFFDITGGLEAGPPYSAAWSIGIEEKFYLVWPLLGFVALRSRLGGRLAVCAVAGIVFALAPGLWEGGKYVFEYVFIVAGAVLALLLHDRRCYERLSVLGRPGPVLASFAALAAMQVAGVLDERGFRLLDGAIIAAALAGIVMSHRADTGWLRCRPMILLGNVSYVFYLTHNFAINAVEKSPLGTQDLAHSFGVVAVAFPLAVGVAWVLHVAVEKPFIRLGHRLASRDKPIRAV